MTKEIFKETKIIHEYTRESPFGIKTQSIVTVNIKGETYTRNFLYTYKDGICVNSLEIENKNYTDVFYDRDSRDNYDVWSKK